MEKPAVYSFGFIGRYRFFLHAFIFSEIIQRPFYFINPNADYGLIAKGLLLALPGVLMEEIIFRGYCLTKAL
jgi:membrane protease YdiL (CAAX protease family)